MVQSSITDYIDCSGATFCKSNLPYLMLMELSGQNINVYQAFSNRVEFFCIEIGLL